MSSSTISILIKSSLFLKKFLRFALTKPEIKYQINIKELKELNDKQWKILSISKDYVKRGGLLIYSTCSILKLENEMMLKRFLEENNDFTLEKFIKHMPSEKINDGFFISYLRKD